MKTGEAIARARRATLAVLLTSLMAGAARAEDHLWAKVGATDAAEQVDLAACKHDSRDVPTHVQGGAYVPATPAGAIGGAIGMMIVEGIAKAKAEATFDRHCMRRHGYVWLPLTPAEEAALNKAPGDASKAAWIDAFYAGDITARLDEAWKPVVPPLPEGLDEPYAFGGVRFDPAVLTVAAGPVTAGGTVLSGVIAHRRTARLKSAVDVSAIAKLHFDAGTIFHQVVLPTDFDPVQTYWCGPVREATLLAGVRSITVCVFTDDKGYRLAIAGNQPWLSDAPAPAGALWKDVIADFSMEESDTDLLGPMDFALTVGRIGSKTVSLAAKATKDGKSVALWDGDLPFGADGVAVLPFWGCRLVLTRTGKAVTAAFTPDGDGAGWLNAKMASR